MLLHKYSKKYNFLFIGGFLAGSVIEYLVSLFGEMILHVKWWDYSDMPLNINGRICVFFSFFWGFLSIYLVASLNPKIDKFINFIKSKINIKVLKTLTISVIIFLFIDFIISIISMNLFLIRMIAENDLNVPNKEIIMEQYEKVHSNEKLTKFIDKYWGNRKMIRTFPNKKVQDVNGNIIFMNSLLKDIQPYYLKIHEPRKLDLNFIKQ